MGLMVNLGAELVRYNPANGKIEFSTNQGRTWLMRNSASSLGGVKSLIFTCGEMLLCSDEGLFFSSNAGRTWLRRTTAFKDFIDLQDCGREILASTADGHLFFSTNQGRTWLRRR